MASFFSETIRLGDKTAGKIFGVTDLASMQALTPAAIVGTVVKTVLALLGVVFTVLVIWGAIKWMTSRGEEEVITEAKNLIVNATIGLALAVAGYTITVLVVDLILRSVTGQTLIPPP